MFEEIIVVPGSATESYTCITADTRPYPWHGWERAAAHIHHMKGFAFYVQMESADQCLRVAEACAATMKPPQSVVPKFGWGRPIHPGDKPAKIKGVGE